MVFFYNILPIRKYTYKQNERIFIQVAFIILNLGKFGNYVYVSLSIFHRKAFCYLISVYYKKLSSFTHFLFISAAASSKR